MRARNNCWPVANVCRSTFPVKPTKPCAACGRPTAEPRRGCCWACYFRARTAREVAESCACCGTRDRRVLGLQTLADGPTTLCGNCGRVAGKRKMLLDALRAEVFPTGDRRQQGRRAIERRTFTERRQEVDVAKLLNSDQREVGRRTTDAAFSALLHS